MAQVFIPAALDDYGLTLAQFRVYCRIARRCGPDGVCWESVDAVAIGCRVNVKTARQAINDLAAFRLVTVNHRPGITSTIAMTDESEWLQPIGRAKLPGRPCRIPAADSHQTTPLPNQRPYPINTPTQSNTHPSPNGATALPNNNPTQTDVVLPNNTPTTPPNQTHHTPPKQPPTKELSPEGNPSEGNPILKETTTTEGVREAEGAALTGAVVVSSTKFLTPSEELATEIKPWLVEWLGNSTAADLWEWQSRRSRTTARPDEHMRDALRNVMEQAERVAMLPRLFEEAIAIALAAGNGLGPQQTMAAYISGVLDNKLTLAGAAGLLPKPSVPPPKPDIVWPPELAAEFRALTEMGSVRLTDDLMRRRRQMLHDLERIGARDKVAIWRPRWE